MVRIVVTGGRGQLARDLVRQAGSDEVIALSRAGLDVTDRAGIAAMLDGLRPEAVINTAAFHQVDRCESEPEMSFLVNAAAPQRLAAACAAHGALLVHVSTDYVFDGRQRTPYAEGDPVGPLSVYAASKAAGEMAVRATTNRHLIVRTSGLYGCGGRETRQGNFVETMLRLADSQPTISVVDDQVLTPSATADVAGIILSLIRCGATGTVHATNAGACSWYEFAAEVFSCARLDVDLRPTTQEARPAPARRPAYSVLGHRALRAAGLPEPRPWQEALAEYLAHRSG